MSSSRELQAAREAAGERLDRFLAEQLPELTRSQIKRLIDDGLVNIAGAAVKAGLKLRGGETVGILLPEAEPVAAAPEAIPLTILYEDPHLIVIDKPAHMVVHPAPGHRGGTLVNALLHHCQDLSGIGGVLRPGIVHRLDKDTSGVMVATKSDRAHAALATAFAAKSRGEPGGIERTYLGIASPAPPTDTGTYRTNYGDRKSTRL